MSDIKTESPTERVIRLIREDERAKCAAIARKFIGQNELWDQCAERIALEIECQ